MASKKIGDFDDGVSFRSGDQLLISRGGKNYRIDGASIANLAAIASTGSYADLKNKPAIPTKVSDLTNDSGFLTAVTIANTGVAAGTYANPTITVQADGRITLVANGTGGSATLTNTGVIAGSYINPLLTIGADGRISQAANGASGGSTLPSLTGQAGKYLTTNGTAVAWTSAPSTAANSTAFKYWKVEVWNSTGNYLGLNTLDLLQDNETVHTANSVTALNGAPAATAWFDRSDSSVADYPLGGTHVSYMFTYGVSAAIKQIRLVQYTDWPGEFPSDIVLSCSDDATNWNQLQVFSGIPRGPGNFVSYFLNVTQSIPKPVLPTTTGNEQRFLSVSNNGPVWTNLPATGAIITQARYWRFVFSNYAGSNGTLGRLKIFQAANATAMPVTVIGYSSQYSASEPASALFDYSASNTAQWSALSSDTRPYVDVDLGAVIQPGRFEFTARADSYASQTFKYCDVFGSQDGKTYLPVQSIPMPNIAVSSAVFSANAASLTIAPSMASGPVTAKNFAIRYHAGSGAYSFSAAEIQFLDKNGNVVPTANGTAYARGFINSNGQDNVPARAFDGDPSTWWEDQPDGGSITQPADSYIGYIFPSPVQVSGFKITCRTGRTDVEAKQVATTLSLQTSTDSKVFSTIQSFSSKREWDSGETRTFLAPWSASTGNGSSGGGGGMVPPPVSLFCSVQGTAVNASPNVRYSRGVSSVTKIADGVYKITFSTPFSDLFYAVEGSCRMENDGGSLVDSHLSIDRRYQPNSGKNVDSVYVVLTYQGAGIYDPKIMEFWMRAYDPRLHM